MTEALDTTSTDPMPEEIRERLERARAALGAVVDTGDYPAYCRAKAAAKRELADAYQAAYESVPLPPRMFHYAMRGASMAQRKHVDFYERVACQVERERAMSNVRIRISRQVESARGEAEAAEVAKQATAVAS